MPSRLTAQVGQQVRGVSPVQSPLSSVGVRDGPVLRLHLLKRVGFLAALVADGAHGKDHGKAGIPGLLRHGHFSSQFVGAVGGSVTVWPILSWNTTEPERGYCRSANSPHAKVCRAPEQRNGRVAHVSHIRPIFGEYYCDPRSQKAPAEHDTPISRVLSISCPSTASFESAGRRVRARPGA